MKKKLKSCKPKMQTGGQMDDITQSRMAAVADLLDQGITDPEQMLNFLNYDDQGNEIGDFTKEEILQYVDQRPGNTENQSATELQNIPPVMDMGGMMSGYHIMPDGTMMKDSDMSKGGSLTPEKAQKILNDGKVYGKPITDKQKKFFGSVANMHKGGEMMRKVLTAVLKKRYGGDLPAEYQGVGNPVERCNMTFITALQKNSHTALIDDLVKDPKSFQTGGESNPFADFQNFFYNQPVVPPGMSGPQYQAPVPQQQVFPFEFYPAFYQSEQITAAGYDAQGNPLGLEAYTQSKSPQMQGQPPLTSVLPNSQNDTTLYNTGTPDFNQPEKQITQPVFKRKINPEVAVNTALMGMNALAAWKERKDKPESHTSADNVFTPVDYSAASRGDYDTNSGAFRPDQMVPIQFRGYSAAFGGQFNEGGEYNLSPLQIIMLRKQGYDLEYLD
jgi:hypothetical protein